MLPGSSTALPLPGGKSTGRSLERFSRRSACDRCRSYKLRCEREPGPEATLQPCRRCARAAAKCVSVGRLRPSPEKQTTVEVRGSGNRQYATPCRILPAATKALPISQPPSYYNDSLESMSVDGVCQSVVSGDIELNFSNTLDDVTQEAFDFDFSFGVTGQSPGEDLINFDSQLPITHVVEPFQDETLPIRPGPDSLKSDNRKNCLQNLANLHASLLQDLDEVKLSKPAGECDCSRVSTSKTSENKEAPDHPIGKVLKNSEKYLGILECFAGSPPPQTSLQQDVYQSNYLTNSSNGDLDSALGWQADGSTPPVSDRPTIPLDCDVPTTFTLLTCYISLIRIFRTIFSCIYISLLPLPPPTWNSLPPIFPGLQLAGFAMEGQTALQIRILLQVSEDMLEKIEEVLGVSGGGSGDKGVLGTVMAKNVLAMMVKEEEGEKPEGGCGASESLRGVMASLKALC